MPTYEYKCEACGNTFEKFQSITAAPIKKCPKCGKNKVKRLIGTGAGLIFKGSGFYITDYRSEQYKNAAKSETGGGTGEKAAEKTSGGDSKPAAPEKAAKSESATPPSTPSPTPSPAPKKESKRPKSS